MADIILVAVTLAFIAICVGYVNWCDRIIGPDDLGSQSSDVTPVADRAATAAPSDAGEREEVTA